MEPITELDARFSSPDADAASWEAVRQVISEAQLFWITTVRADGRPHVTPLVAVWLDDSLHFCTGADEQKAVNLETNPEVVLTTGCNGWQEGLDVVGGPSDRREGAQTTGRGLGREVGRILAIRSERRLLLAWRGWRRDRLSGEAAEGAQLQQGNRGGEPAPTHIVPLRDLTRSCFRSA